MEVFPGLTDLAVLRSEPGRQLYRAQHSGLARPVAVQALSMPMANDESVKRFEQTCARVHDLTGDPTIAPVHAWGLTEDGRPYVVTDFVEDGSLADRVREAGPLPVADVLKIGITVAGALAAAHEHQAAHGDVRPNYLLVAPSGEPMLGGFGFSVLAADPASGAPLPAHAAPEIVDGRPGDAVSDLYSLGSTLLTLLTGCGPEAALVDCLNRADELAGPSPALLPLERTAGPLPQGVVDMLTRIRPRIRRGDPRTPVAPHSSCVPPRRRWACRYPSRGAASSPPSPHGGGNADDAGRIIEPQLTVLSTHGTSPP